MKATLKHTVGTAEGLKVVNRFWPGVRRGREHLWRLAWHKFSRQIVWKSNMDYGQIFRHQHLTIVDCSFEIRFEDELDFVVVIDNDQCEWVTMKDFEVHTKKYLWLGEIVHNKTSSAIGHKLQQKGK